MRKKEFLLFLFIFFSTQILFSQEKEKIFDKYLAENITENPRKIKSIRHSLEIYAAIDPNLIYFYIRHLESLQNVDSSEINWRDIFQKKLARAKYLQKEWAKLEKTAIKKEITPAPLAKRISLFYDKYDYVFVHQMVVEPKVKIDENKLNFFKYLYLSGNASAKFDPETDYRTLFTDALEKKINELNELYKSLKHSTSEQTINEFIVQARRFPFIFNGSYLKDIPLTTDFHIYQFLADYYKKDFLNHHSIYLQLSGLILPFSINESFETTDPFDSHFKYDYTVNIDQKFLFYLGFKWKLKEEFQPFSFINIAIGLPVYTIYSSTFKDITLFKGIMAVSGLKYDGSYLLTNFRDLKSIALLSRITMPVYYYSDKIFFEAGVSYSFINVSYKYDFIKDGTVTHPYSPEPPDFFKTMKETIEHKSSHHLFFPTIAVNYYLKKNLNIRFEYLIPLQGGISVGYYFNF